MHAVSSCNFLARNTVTPTPHAVLGSLSLTRQRQASAPGFGPGPGWIWSPPLVPSADLSRALFVPPRLECKLLEKGTMPFINLPKLHILSGKQQATDNSNQNGYHSLSTCSGPAL